MSRQLVGRCWHRLEKIGSTICTAQLVARKRPPAKSYRHYFFFSAHGQLVKRSRDSTDAAAVPQNFCPNPSSTSLPPRGMHTCLSTAHSALLWAPFSLSLSLSLVETLAIICRGTKGSAWLRHKSLQLLIIVSSDDVPARHDIERARDSRVLKLCLEIFFPMHNPPTAFWEDRRR